MSDNVAFNTLVELSTLSREHASGLPAQIDIKQQWTGVGFSIFGQNFVAPMGEVSEMLEMPNYTHLPGVTSWVKGVANVRGRLLPLTDLAIFLGGTLESSFRMQRVLVIEIDEIYSGLVVDAVYGMQHFPTDNYSQTVENGTEDLSPYLQGTFVSEAGDSWTVFSPWTVVRSEKFFQAAIASIAS